MKRFLFLFSVLYWAGAVQAQDVDIYQRQKNDNFDFPERPARMTFEEYELLHTELRMQDMFAAAVVPGYVHFIVKEKKKAWYLVGIRAVGYGGLVYLSLNNKSFFNVLFNPADKYFNKNHTVDAIVAYSSAILIAGGFLYDWIHGRYILHHKQTRIRFKYSPVVGFATSPADGSYLSTWGIRISF